MTEVHQGPCRHRRATLTASALVALCAVLPAAPAQAITARYSATLTGKQLYSASGSYTLSGPSCSEKYTAGSFYKATFATRQFRLTVSSRQGRTFSPKRLAAAVEQENSFDESTQISGDPDCGESSDPPPVTRKCGPETNRNLRVLHLFEDTAVKPVNNRPDTMRRGDDRLTISGGLLNRCYPRNFGTNQQSRDFFPATTGAQRLAKLLSPNTKRITLTGRRVQRETGPMRDPAEGISGDWDSLLASSWRLVLKRTR